MAGNGGHGNVRLDGGISAEVEAQRGILAISPQQHSLGNLGVFMIEPMLSFVCSSVWPV
jgi:hypothetical protein